MGQSINGEVHRRSLALIDQARDFGEVRKEKKSALFAGEARKFRQRLG